MTYKSPKAGVLATVVPSRPPESDENCSVHVTLIILRKTRAGFAIPFVICSQWVSLCWFVCVLCVSVAIPATVLSSCWCCLCCVGSRNGCQGWAAIVTKRREEVRGFGVKNVREKCWLMPSLLMRGRSGCVNSVPNPMYGRGGAAGDATTTSTQSCGENTSWRLWRKRVSGPLVLRRQVEERRRSRKIQEAEIKELRAQIKQLRKQQRGEAGQERQGDPARRESGLEADWSMDCGEEVQNRKKLDEQRGMPQRQLRELEKFTDAPQDVQSLKENLQQKLQDVVQKRNDLLPEHQRVQKRSQKIQSGPG